jgi:lactoylglutathione lyase
MIEKMAGVIIWTEDLDRLLSFYRDTLGLTPHAVHPDFVAFRWGDTRLSLGKHSEVTGQAKDPHRIMINLATTEIHHAYEKLSEKGVRFVRPPEREHWGGWVSTFTDPDGNILQMLQQPETGS